MVAVLTLVSCSRDKRVHQASAPASASTKIANKDVLKPATSAATASSGAFEDKPAPRVPEERAVPEPKVEEIIEGNFRGRNQASRVIFLDNLSIVHAWDDNGTERREPVTTEYPPGHRECKALRSLGSQDFLLCMYWYTGPGGGRVDGVLFDIKRRILGEFFSAAMNIEPLNTLCWPETMVGPMPSFNMGGWSIIAATADNDAQVLVTVSKTGWSTKEAEAVRALPAMKKFCECVGGENCPGEPIPPKGTSTIVYRLKDGQLNPTDESRKVLGEIAAQWGHSPFLRDWNLTMRGF